MWGRENRIGGKKGLERNSRKKRETRDSAIKKKEYTKVVKQITEIKRDPKKKKSKLEKERKV